MDLIFSIFVVVVVVLVVATLLPSKSKTQQTKVISRNTNYIPPTQSEEQMNYCHAYLVREVDDNDVLGDVKIVSRQNLEEVSLLPCIAREVTIAFDTNAATIAICNPFRDRKTGKLDHFSRLRGREIAGGRLQKLQAKNIAEGEVLVPRLQDFPANQVRESLNMFLRPRREEMRKIKPRVQTA